MQKYIDAHCHIGNGRADPSVAGFICNSVDASQWADILALSEKNSAVVPCLGVHPWCAGNVAPDWDTRLSDAMATHPKCMVGEIGLDKLHPHYDAQISVFTRCMQIATAQHRAVHIHCVHAWNDMIRILSDKKFSVPAIVLHGFTAGTEIMAHLARLDNVYFSFGCAVCDTRRARLATTVHDTPLTRILIESDGDMCESGAVLRDVARRIAEIKDMDADKLSRIIYDNTIRVIQNG